MELPFVLVYMCASLQLVCLFTTCGHVYDSSQPFWYGTDNMMDFWEDVMDLEADEIVWKLELEHLQTLHDALKEGTCCWAYMTRQQCAQYQERLVERQNAGEVVGKPHKKCSDMGRKRCRTEAKGKASKSTAFIDSSDEQSEEDDM